MHDSPCPQYDLKGGHTAVSSQNRREDVRMNRLTIICFSAFLAACATAEGPTGPVYPEHALSAGAVDPGMARLYFFWPEPVARGDVAMMVTIDGSNLGACQRGGFSTHDVPAGAHVLSTGRKSVPGRCDVRVDVLGGSTYFYELKTRAEYQLAAAPGAILALIPFPPTWLIGSALLFGGMAIESSGKECGGPVSLAPVEESAALPKISGLRKSK